MFMFVGLRIHIEFLSFRSETFMMAVSGQNHNPNEDYEYFLHQPFSSTEEFQTKYGMFCGEQSERAKQGLYLRTLTELKLSVESNKVENFKKLCVLLDRLSKTEHLETLKNYYNDIGNAINPSNLVILACQYKSVKTLKLLIHNFSNVLDNLSVGIGKSVILPCDVDKIGHDAFYYAILSNNISILNTLIDKWPNNYFSVNLDVLNKLISKNYEELCLKNVPLSYEMHIFVISKLANFRFSSESSQKIQTSFKTCDILGLIELIIENVKLLNSFQDVNETFLFVANNVAENCNVLKCLKSTYTKLPWYEIEFSLTCFIMSYLQKHENSIFYRIKLNKKRILNHLTNFAEQLEKEKDNILRLTPDELMVFPQVDREENVSNIIKNCSNFKTLYEDFQQIQDLYSLNKITEYGKLVLKANPKENVFQQLVIRLLQIVGENCKDTLESPKLSTYLGEFVLQELPVPVRKTAINLRRSNTIENSLPNRIDSESGLVFNRPIEDMKVFVDSVAAMLLKCRGRIAKQFLEKLAYCEDFEIGEFKYLLKPASESRPFKEYFEQKQYDIMDLNSLELLVYGLDNNIDDRTPQEAQLFKKLQKILQNASGQDSQVDFDEDESPLVFTDKIVQVKRDILQEESKKLLKDMKSKVQPHYLSEVVKLLTELFHSLLNRKIEYKNAHNLVKAIYYFYYFAEIDTEKSKLFKQFRPKFMEKGYCIFGNEEPSFDLNQSIDFKAVLKKKVTQLELNLRKHKLGGELSSENYLAYKVNKSLQAVLEILVLDILSILNRSNRLNDNIQFPHDFCVFLCGKPLLRLLDQDEILTELIDLPTAILFNARKIHSENILANENIINKVINNDFAQVKAQFERNLRIITNQNELFLALENGNFEEMHRCLDKGADLNGRTLHLSTSLHFASKGSNVDIVKYIHNRNQIINTKDDHDRSPVHVSAEFGRDDIVKYFLEKVGAYNDQIYDGKTALHLAVRNGHQNTVEILLMHKCTHHTDDMEGFPPLYYAVSNDYIPIAKILLDRETDNRVRDLSLGASVHSAASLGHLEMLKFLLGYKTSVKSKVNYRNPNGHSPLYVAAQSGQVAAMELLIANGAKVRTKNNFGMTPLHAAAGNGHVEVIELLIRHRVDINARGKGGISPLEFACFKGRTKVVELLLNNNVQIEVTGFMDQTPLHLAAANGSKEIVELLIKHGADVDTEDLAGSTPLKEAIERNDKDLVEVLVKHGATFDCFDDESPLGLAADKGNPEIVKMLLSHGADVDGEFGEPLLNAVYDGNTEVVKLLLEHRASLMDNGDRLLGHAAEHGNSEIVRLLSAHGANVNSTHNGLTPLHQAVVLGYPDVVEILLSKGAKINIKALDDKTPLDVAVAYDHLEIVKLFFKHRKININARDGRQFTILHIAAQMGNLEMTKYLIEKGANIQAKNDMGTRPIHIAAREGRNEIVKYFLSIGVSLESPGAVNQTPLFYSAIEGHTDLATYLIEQGADVHAKDNNGTSMAHIAALSGCKELLELLLKNGAIYNGLDVMKRKPLDMAQDINVMSLLTTTDNLFDSVKRNKNEEVMSCIRKGAPVTARNTERSTPLHFASWKGFDRIVTTLLEHNADPNASGNKGCRPLHYATKFSHLQVVKTLLSHGAVYDLTSSNGKTPLDFALDDEIIKLLKLVSETFKNVTNDNCEFVNVLKNLKDKDTVKAVINARNKDNNTVIIVASENNFSKLEELKNILKEEDLSFLTDMGDLFIFQEKYDQALAAYTKVYDHKKVILGHADPTTLEAQTKIAEIFSKKQQWQKCLDILQDVHEKQVNTVGEDSKEALSTRSAIALKLHRLGKDKEALEMFRDSLKKQKNILPPDDNDVLNTESHMAMVLQNMGVYNEALQLNYDVLEKRTKTLGKHHAVVYAIRNNIALILGLQKKYDEALKEYQRVYEGRKKILGPTHSDTLRTFHNMISVLSDQNRTDEAVHAYKDLYEIQDTVLGSNHLDTLTTKYNMGILLLSQDKYVAAYKLFKESLDQRRQILGDSHPHIIDTKLKLNFIEWNMMLRGENPSELTTNLQNRFIIAASGGDVKAIRELLSNGADVNEIDKNGRSPLHYAIDKAHTAVVNVLLKEGADPTVVTSKGNTSLHIAVYRNNMEVIKALFNKVNRDKLHEFMNAKTTGSGTSALHLAAKLGSLEIVKFLLRQGAVYDIKNNEGKTPHNVAKDRNVIGFLKSVTQYFDEVAKGNRTVVEKLEQLNRDDLLAIINVRNHSGSTLFQLSLIHKQSDLSTELLRVLRSVGSMDEERFEDQSCSGLFKAVENDDYPTVEKYCREGGRVHVRSSDGKTPLHLAVNNNNKDMVNLLIKNGADVGHSTRKGNTALHTATLKANREIVEILLQSADKERVQTFINTTTTTNGMTALHVAASNGHLDIVRSLLNHGAAYDIENVERKTPFQLTQSEDIKNLLKLVNEIFKDANATGSLKNLTVLKKESLDNFTAVVNSRNYRGKTIIQTGTDNNHSELVGQLAIEILNKTMKTFDGKKA